MRSSIAICIIIAATAACVPHAKLSAPPPPTAASKERIEAYDRLSARGRTATPGRHQADSDGGYLILGDGTVVFHPDDLIAVVPPDSPPARAGRAYRRSWRSAKRWLIAGGLTFVAAAAIPITGVALIDDPDKSLKFAAATAIPGIVIGTALLGVGVFEANRSARERISAFHTYDDALRRQLALCVDGLNVVDCSTASPTATSGNRPIAAP